MKRAIRTSWLWLFVIVAVACGDANAATGPQAPEDVTFAAILGIDLSQMTRLPSGVYIQTLTPGTGDGELTVSDNWDDHLPLLARGRDIRPRGAAALRRGLHSALHRGFRGGDPRAQAR